MVTTKTNLSTRELQLNSPNLLIKQSYKIHKLNKNPLEYSLADDFSQCLPLLYSVHLQVYLLRLVFK